MCKEKKKIYIYIYNLFIILVGTSCLWSTVEAVWTRPMTYDLMTQSEDANRSEDGQLR